MVYTRRHDLGGRLFRFRLSHIILSPLLLPIQIGFNKGTSSWGLPQRCSNQLKAKSPGLIIIYPSDSYFNSYGLILVYIAIEWSLCSNFFLVINYKRKFFFGSGPLVVFTSAYRQKLEKRNFHSQITPKRDVWSTGTKEHRTRSEQSTWVAEHFFITQVCNKTEGEGLAWTACETSPVSLEGVGVGGTERWRQTST